MKILFLFLFILSLPLYSQNKTDIALIGVFVSQANYNDSDPIAIKKRTYNPAKIMLNGLLTFYQKLLSPQISASCLYNPSCSRFSRNALIELGAIRGVLLTADRLTRCNYMGSAQIPGYRKNKLGLIVDEPWMYHYHKR